MSPVYFKLIRATMAMVSIVLIGTFVRQTIVTLYTPGYRAAYFQIDARKSTSLANLSMSSHGNIKGEETENDMMQTLYSDMENETIQQYVQNLTKGTEITPIEPKSRLVLLLSSTGRSGSSFVGDLLSTMNSTVYFYEPLKFYPATDKTGRVKILKDVFRCDLDKTFVEQLTKKAFFIQHFNEESRMLPLDGVRRSRYLAELNMTNDCLRSKVRLVKVIRARVRDLDTLLQEDSLNLRVIHLFRDPRGSTLSSLEFGTKPNCLDVYDDMIAFPLLSAKYPGKLIQVSYEQVSLYPTKYAKLMFEHVYDSRTLPETTKNFIESHTKTNNVLPMSTFRDSYNTFQAWRDKISPDLLSEIESNDECRRALHIMNYRVFGNVQDVRNKEIPLFGNITK